MVAQAAEPSAILELKSQLKGKETDTRVWGSWSRTKSQLTWYEKRFPGMNWENLPDWHLDNKVPDHVQKLPVYRQFIHKDHPGLKWFNTNTKKGRAGISVFTAAMTVYFVMRAKRNSAIANNKIVNEHQAARALVRRNREHDGTAWWAKH